MKKKIVLISILCSGLWSITYAQTCDCSLSLKNIKNEVKQYYKNKTLPKGEYAATKIYDRFKAFANQTVTKEDCQELIADYLNMFEDVNMKQQLYLKNKQTTLQKK